MDMGMAMGIGNWNAVLGWINASYIHIPGLHVLSHEQVVKEGAAQAQQLQDMEMLSVWYVY
ncbi:hypothetical protein EON63_10200 [archaeon]|nr:MAG: hypothetical protein EON63_10200 [archaeon]